MLKSVLCGIIDTLLPHKCLTKDVINKVVTSKTTEITTLPHLLSLTQTLTKIDRFVILDAYLVYVSLT